MTGVPGVQTADKAVLEVFPEPDLQDDARISEVVARLVSPGQAKT